MCRCCYRSVAIRKDAWETIFEQLGTKVQSGPSFPARRGHGATSLPYQPHLQSPLQHPRGHSNFVHTLQLPRSSICTASPLLEVSQNQGHPCSNAVFLQLSKWQRFLGSEDKRLPVCSAYPSLKKYNILRHQDHQGADWNEYSAVNPPQVSSHFSV